MLTTNTIRYGTDNFNFRNQSLVDSSEPLYANSKMNIDGFTLEGTQIGDSDRRVIFRINDKYYKFNSTSKITEYTGVVDLDNILTNGNSVDELMKVKSIPEWVEKKIYPVIALDSSPDVTTLPSLKISLKTSVKRQEGKDITNPKKQIEVGNLINDGSVIWKVRSMLISDTSERKILLGVDCNKGQILGYKPGGFVMCDNMDFSTMNGVVYAQKDGKQGQYVDAMSRGNANVSAADGASAYVGNDGAITYDRPTTSKCYVKCLGHVEQGLLIFEPDSLAIQIR